MGNLSLQNNPASYSRKPIFNPANRLSKCQVSRSMSPYLLQTSRSRNQKNHFANLHFRDKVSHEKTRSGNRIYLNPALVRSVIKDTSTDDVVSPANKRLKRSTRGHMATSQILPTRGSSQAGPFFGSRKMYAQKPFQESSPRKQERPVTKLGNGKSGLECDTEKENSFKVRTWRENSERFKPAFDFTSSTLNKSNISLSRFLNSGCNSTRNYGADGHLLPLRNESCCVQHLCLLSEKQQTIIRDNAPTQRKRSMRVAQPQWETMNEEAGANMVRISEQGDLNFETGKKTSNFHNENREKCQEIIKRVRNFNQFLNQIKGKIRKEYPNLSSSHNTIQNSSMSEPEQQSYNDRSGNTSLDYRNHDSSAGTEMQESKANISRSITLALRLENERIELEKYRKLVERELSKQHSIESIEIETKNKQKIITINFDRPSNSESGFKKPKGKTINQEGTGKTAGKTEQMSRSRSEVESGEAKIEKRMSKINNLFTKMEGMNQAQIETYKQISEILQEQESGDSTI